MNKTLFHYCQKHLRFTDTATLKVNASLKKLANHYHIGYIENGRYYFNSQDKLQLIDIIAQELNGLRLSDSYPQTQSRTQVAKHQRNEKTGAVAVTEGFVLLNSLQDICVNHQVIQNSTISSLGHFLCASQIDSVQHSHIVLVENLCVMANLARLNIPESLKDALWVYRGDVKAQQKTSTANHFFRRFNAVKQLICFSDFDPAGLQIALSCGAQQWLTLAHVEDVNINLAGAEQEWFNQKNAITFINKHSQVNDAIASLFSTMNHHQKTLKQEHMVEHSLPLVLYPLN